MAAILAGTSGYFYKDWIGPVYPAGTRSSDLLPYYAALFPTVELNFSYYKMPTADQLARLLEQGGPVLIFSIKANDALTHKINPGSWKDAAHAFLHAIEPLCRENRLGAVLFQFPYSFHYDIERRRYLGDLLRIFAGMPAAVEFRHIEWYNERVINALQERQVALVSLDMPLLKGLPPLTETVTAPFAYIRFHGRNQSTWWTGDQASRYDYLYVAAELNPWAERIRRISAETNRTLIYFNNHPKGQAVENVHTLMQMLAQPGV